ncbi:hypothetical protein ACS0TY_001709 [Phlomoides rotata]
METSGIVLVAGVAVLAEEPWRKKGLTVRAFVLYVYIHVILDLSAYDGLKLCIKGDGNRYKLMVRISCDWDTVAYTIGFDTVKDQWQSVRLPFSSLGPIFRARTVYDAPPFDPSACFHEFYTYVQQVRV